MPNSNVVHSNGTAVLAMESGSRATLTFTGTNVEWIGYRDEWSGIARVILDGAEIALVDTYASPLAPQVVNYALQNLAPQQHTLAIEVTGQKNAASSGSWVWVDGFNIR